MKLGGDEAEEDGYSALSWVCDVTACSKSEQFTDQTQTASVQAERTVLYLLHLVITLETRVAKAAAGTNPHIPSKRLKHAQALPQLSLFRLTIF